ncbi:MAG: NifU family protein [Candidatus Hydrogenedentes bacterium]|nr:NifU family protein [Candidatus Hydrogenedentota bacterium]
MPAWFSKVFKGGAASARPREAHPLLDEVLGGIDTSDDPEPSSAGRAEKKRRIVNAPIVEFVGETAASSADIRIKARIDNSSGGCVLLIDRPILEGHSAWFPTAKSAEHSPLAQAIFAIDGVVSVLLHGYTITVTRHPARHGDWTDMAREIGNVVRGHLIDEKPIVSDEFLAGLPSADTIQQELQKVIDTEINPSIAAHSGAIALDRVEGNTVYIQMMGGCQGCAASDVTLRQGIYEAFRSAVPQIGAILDNTDHSAGKNPFYTRMPVGMS